MTCALKERGLVHLALEFPNKFDNWALDALLYKSKFQKEPRFWTNLLATNIVDL
jgi:hypothetical protein